MVVVFLCIYCAKINFFLPGSPAHFAHAQLTVSVINNSGNGSDFCSLFSMYRTKFDATMTKSKWNYTVNMIMNVLGTDCQRIHYFPGKQGLAIDPTWPTLKVNNAHGFDIVSWSVWIIILLPFGVITKYIINKISYSLGTRKGGRVNWTFKQSRVK